MILNPPKHITGKLMGGASTAAQDRAAWINEQRALGHPVMQIAAALGVRKSTVQTAIIHGRDEPVSPLMAFWSRTRRTFLPLTASEWARRSGAYDKVRIEMLDRGYVTRERTHGTGVVVYELTDAGKDMIRAATVEPLP